MQGGVFLFMKRLSYITFTQNRTKKSVHFIALLYTSFLYIHIKSKMFYSLSAGQ